MLDAKGRYISPSFIDGHVHIESTMTTPRQLCQVLLPHGVTTLITDPHEIANVAGTSGIQFMLDDSENLPLDMMFMLPSCVPATSFESSGATLTARDLKPFYSHPRVIGLAEVMDFPSVKSQAPDMMAKLQEAKIIDGHGAGLDEVGLNIYKTAHILTDHECTTSKEALNRISRGIYVQIREGSAAKNLKDLISCVNERNSNRFLFCTDDKHLNELIDEGSIDYNVRLAIESGCNPLIAIQMASINAATCYHLMDKGAIAPGYVADFLLLDDLETVQISEVYKNGNLVSCNGEYVGPDLVSVSKPEKLFNSVHLAPITVQDLQLPLASTKANVIGIKPNSIITDHLILEVDARNGYFSPSIVDDQLKLAVVERHLKTGNIGLGIVKGFGIKCGAVATSIAHDSHNLMVVGTNDDDMLQAIKELEWIEGGVVIVKNGKTISTLALPIGGLMTGEPITHLQHSIHQLETALLELGFAESFDFLLTLSFLSLPVIPKLKLTNQGLFDAQHFKHIDVNDINN
jgi:adenine deaminase